VWTIEFWRPANGGFAVNLLRRTLPVRLKKALAAVSA
jgi:hypothetical protein